MASSIFRSLPPTRPPRTTPPGLVRWSGYIDGSYLTTDLTPNVLRATHVVGSNAQYQTYMLSAWSPLLLIPEAETTGTSYIALTDAQLAAGPPQTRPSAPSGRRTTASTTSPIRCPWRRHGSSSRTRCISRAGGRD